MSIYVAKCTGCQAERTYSDFPNDCEEAEVCVKCGSKIEVTEESLDEEEC